MPERGYPYENVRISTELSDVQYAALRSMDLSAAALSGDIVAIGTQNITTLDILEDAKTFAPTRSYGEIDRTSLADTARVIEQGRGSAEITLGLYVNYAVGKSYDAVIKDPSGIRLLYVERATGRKFVALVSVITVTEPATDEAGDLVVEVAMRNSGGVMPSWV